MVSWIYLFLLGLLDIEGQLLFLFLIPLHNREGTMGCLLHQSQQFYNNGFLTSEKLPIVIYRRGYFCIIIEDVHQFIGHCLIPLDPCCLSSLFYFFLIQVSSWKRQWAIKSTPQIIINKISPCVLMEWTMLFCKTIIKINQRMSERVLETVQCLLPPYKFII